MSIQHQSYLELKKDVGEEFTRKTILYNLESLKNNIRATARAMKCSAHTVYLALEKAEVIVAVLICLTQAWHGFFICRSSLMKYGEIWT